MKTTTKRLVSIVLIIMMLMTSIPFSAMAAEESNKFCINVSQEEGAPGESVDVVISIKNNPGLGSLKFNVEYGDYLTLENVAFNSEFGSFVTAPEPYTNPQSISMMSPTSEITTEGTFATLTFTISEDAPNSYVSDIKITYEPNDICDGNLDNIDTDVENGKVTICRIPGDINGDDYVDNKDAILVFRHSAGWDVGRSDRDIEWMDVNADFYRDNKDAILIFRAAAGWPNITLLPPPAKHKHVLTHTPAKESTCIEYGNIEYWTCDDCGKYFEDEAATKEIMPEDVVTEKAGHTEVVDEAVPPSYTQTGLTEGSHCSVCNTVLVAQQVVPALEASYHAVTLKNLNGAEDPGITRFAEHEGLKLPELSVDGYDFIGWYTAPNGQGEYVSSIKAGTTEDVVLHAHWQIKTYTIYFYDAPENDNATAGNSTAKYTVEDRIVLTDPKWSGLNFVNWTDENGNIYSEIPKGSTGDIELTANWQLMENTAVPADGIRELWTDYDEKNGHQIFIYELGEIQHVVLDELNRKYKSFGESKTWEESRTVSLDNGVSSEVSRTVSNSVTKSYQYQETNEWTKKKSSSFDRGFTIGAETAGIAKLFGTKIKLEGQFNWSSTDETSSSHATTNTEGNETSLENTLSNSSTVSFNETVSKTFATSSTVGSNMPEGTYRYVYYGTVRVFAVVTYEPRSGNYRLDTYSVLGQDIGDMTLYVPPENTTANIKASEGLPCDFPLEELEEFIKNSYYVEYDANGGTEDPDNPMHSCYYPTNQEHTLSENKFVKDGYTWIGWEVDGRERIIQKGEVVSNLGSDGQHLVAKAKWAKNSYTITYDGNKPANASSTVMNVPQDTPCTYDENVTLSSTVPTLTGWTFGGWYTDDLCTDTKKAGDPGKTLTDPNLTTSPGGTVTLYAKWNPYTYTVKYNANGGSGTTTQSEHSYDSSTDLSTNGFKRANYTFLGWSTSSSAKTPMFTDKASVKNLTSLNGGTINLYAVWIKTTWNSCFTIGDVAIKTGDGKNTEIITTDLRPSELISAKLNTLTITLRVHGYWGWNMFDINRDNQPFVEIRDINRQYSKVVNYDTFTELRDESPSQWRTFAIPTSVLSQDGKFIIDFCCSKSEWGLDEFEVTITAGP